MFEFFLFFGLVCVLVSIFLKLGVFPFHWWVVDVYGVAPVGFTSFLLIFPKLFLSFLLLKLSYTLFSFLSIWFFCLCFGLGGLGSVIVGSLLALVQTRVKRFLAASGIANFGFFLIGLSSFDFNSFFSLFVSFFFLFVYFFSVLGICGIVFGITKLTRNSSGFIVRTSVEFIGEFTNLGFVFPFLGWLICIFFFSFAGFPPFGGFFAKLGILCVFLSKPYWFIFFFIILFSTLLGCFYYLQFIKYLFFEDLSSYKPIFSCLGTETFISVFFSLLLGPGLTGVCFIIGFDFCMLESILFFFSNSFVAPMLIGF